MFTNCFFNLLIAATLAAVLMIASTVRQAGAMKTFSTQTNITSNAYLVAPTRTVHYIGGEPAYQLPNGQWVR